MLAMPTAVLGVLFVMDFTESNVPRLLRNRLVIPLRVIQT